MGPLLASLGAATTATTSTISSMAASAGSALSTSGAAMLAGATSLAGGGSKTPPVPDPKGFSRVDAEMPAEPKQTAASALGATAMDYLKKTGPMQAKDTLAKGWSGELLPNASARDNKIYSLATAAMQVGKDTVPVGQPALADSRPQPVATDPGIAPLGHPTQMNTVAGRAPLKTFADYLRETM